MKKTKIVQFMSENPWKTGVTKIMERIANVLGIPAVVINKNIKSRTIKQIGDSGEKNLLFKAKK